MQISSLINIERIIHSLKTCIACLLGFALTRIISFPSDQWVVITVIVVMCAQIYVGSVIQKSYMRFLGTLTGCLFASFMLLMYGQTTSTIAATIGIASFVFSYIATGQERLVYAGTLGAVTTTIIMLGDNPTVTFAAERFLEISIGIFIAAIVSQFILPIHARTHLKRAQVETLTQLHAYYLAAMSSSKADNTDIDYQELDESIISGLQKQRQLAKESRREPLASSFNPDDFSQSLYHEREILRAITFMHTALLHAKQIGKMITQLNAVTAFNAAILTMFDLLKKATQSNTVLKEMLTLPSLDQIKKEIHETMAMPSREELMYINGFLFSAELMLNSLKQLAALYSIPVSIEKPPLGDR